MKKSTLIIVAVIAAVGFFAGSLSAGETEKMLQSRLTEALKYAKADEARSYAEALNAYRQSKAYAEATKSLEAGNAVLTAYGNVVKSAPAIIAGTERFAKAFGDDETLQMCQVFKILLKLSERPLETSETAEVADIAIKAKKDADARFEQMRKQNVREESMR